MEIARAAMAKKQNKRPAAKATTSDQRTYTIPDYRLEKPNFTVSQVRKGGKVVYEVTGDLSAPVPPIRDSNYLNKKQCIEIYRWMVLNRRMEITLENLYKQGKVVGGVDFGRGQEACSCASAYVCSHDPQPGLDPCPRLPSSRHHDAVHGQGWFADRGP